MAGHCIAPVTALTFHNEYIFIGSGCSIDIYQVLDGKHYSSQRIWISGDVVHGIRMHGNDMIVFGKTRAKYFNFNCETKTIQFKFDFGTLPDWTWDAYWLDPDHVVFGFAQGGLMFWDRKSSAEWIAQPGNVSCNARCILYSLKFWKVDGEPWFAGGSVFGDIVLGRASDGIVQRRLVGHQGPVFRVAISDDGSRIVSVGDDRTVRVWKRSTTETSGTVDFEQIWWSFGHSARVWDCSFVDADKVVTVGEDNKIKIWKRDSGDVITTLESHFGRNTWRVAVSPNHQVIATGGGDGAVKFWSVERETTSRQILSSLIVIPVHDLFADKNSESVSPPRKKSKRQSKCVALVKHSRELGSVVVACSDGEILAMPHTLGNTPATWHSIVPGGDSDFRISSMAIGATSHCHNAWFVCGDATGQCRMLFVDPKTFQIAEPPVTWKPCEKRITYIRIHLQKNGAPWLMLSSVDGELSVYDVADLQNPKLVHVMTPTKVDIRNTIASCIWKDRILFGGDINGNIHYSDMITKSECVSLHDAHGKSKVTCLEAQNDILYSAGHNGIILRWQLSSDSKGGFHITCIEVVRMHLIPNIEYILWNSNNELLVGGYNYCDFVLFNNDRRYLLMRDDCGGWRRPGCLVLAHESCTMYYVETSHERQRSAPGSERCAIHRVGRGTFSKMFNVCSLGNNYHSRSAWTSLWISVCNNQKLLLTGCEDGALKLVQLRHKTPFRIQEHASWESMREYEENHTPQNEFEITTTTVGGTLESIRSMGLSQDFPSEHHAFVVTGGGGQLISCWLVDKHNGGNVAFLCEMRPHNDQVDSTQRILSIAAFCVDSSEGMFGRHVVIAGTSEGELLTYVVSSELPKNSMYRVSKLDPKFEHAAGIQHLHSTRHADEGCNRPIRSLVYCSWKNNARVVVIGRTNGMVELWQLDEHFEPKFLESFHSHATGVNAISVSRIDETKSHEVLVSSAGDDQALSLLVFDLKTLACLTNTIRLENACAASLRGIASSGSVVWTVGLNQHVRRWRVRFNRFAEEEVGKGVVNKIWMQYGNMTISSASFDVSLESDVPIEISDINSMNRLPVGTEDDGVNLLAIVGTGLKILQL